MRARQRRLWTYTLTLSAVALIAVVVAVAAFRFLVKVVPGYRDDIEQRVSTTLDQRLTIRELDLSWRRFRPSLDLLDVTLYGDDSRTPALKLRELNIGIDWFALLIGRLQLAELRLAGLALTVERLEDGSLKVSGISSDKPLTAEDLRRIVRAADRVGRVVIADSQLLWLDYTDPNIFHRIDDIELVLRSRGSRHQLQASVELPPDFGGSAQLDARAKGNLENFAELKVEAELQAQNLRIGQWLRPWLRKGEVLEGGDTQLLLRTEWLGRGLQSAAGELRSGALQRSHGGRLQAFMEDVQSEFKISVIEDGWHLSVERLHLDAHARQPATSAGSIDLRPQTETRSLSLTGSVDQIRLDEFGEWLALFDWGRHDWLAELQPVGYVQDLRFQYAAPPPVVEADPVGDPSYSLQCRFEGLGVSPTHAWPGFTGMGGRLKLDQTGGDFLLIVKNGQLLVPRNLDLPVPLTEISANLNWQRQDADWLLTGKDMRWQGPKGLSGRSDLELRILGEGGSPYINFDTRFSGDSWADVRAFFPRVPTISEDARHWIQTAIVDGHVTKGHVQMRGQLDHFPYHNPHEPGLFQFDFDVSDGIIDYAEGWPTIDRINTHVTFKGRTMQINASSARIIGTPVGPVKVEVKDFQTSVLEVHGVAKADAGKMLSFLTESPLRADYTGLVQALKLQGPAKLDLRLEMPLDELEATRVFGVVTLDGRTQLSHAKLPEPIKAINGQVHFDNSGISARDLGGELLGLKLALQMAPEQLDGRHLTRLDAVTQIAFPRDAARLARLASADLLSYLHGSSQLQANMLFDVSAKPAHLQLTSDLKGVSVNLPPPFAKDKDEVLPVTVNLDPTSASGMLADIQYGELLRAALQLRDNQGSWALDRGHIRFGGDTAQLPAKPGVWLDGKLTEVDVSLWQKFFVPHTPVTVKPAAPAPALHLQHADLHIARFLAAEQLFENLRLQLAQEGADWLLTANAESVEGTVRWSKQPGARRTYHADLKHLKLRVTDEEKKDSGSDARDSGDPSPPLDPATLPGLSLNAHSLQVNKHDLGQLRVDAVPIPNGLSLSTLSLNGELGVQGSGSWTRQDGKSSAQASLSAKGNQLKQMFAALGYAPSLDAEKIRLQASLAWAPHVEGIKTEALGGGFSLDLEKGVLMAVEPGAGRVLGLLNFYVLPRRLTLDFSDVLSKGLVFDTLKGDFRIEEGNAWTNNLEIRGPSLQMEIEGRVGLAQRDYDQKVTIHPQVSTGVALAGTLAGGPAVGLALLVAQTLFKKPLEDMSELSYRLRGPWDNPSIEKD